MKITLNTEKPPVVRRISIRNWIQAIVFILTLVVGLQYYLFIQQAMGTGPITIPRPASVEGFLPIGALMSWKRFFMTGQWDIIHPAAMAILGFALALSIAFHKAFCSWFCPVGTLSEWLWKFGKRVLKRNFGLPFWLDTALRSIKYLLLGFFVWVIFSMSAATIAQFIHSPYYKISDAKMLRFFTHMSLTTGIVLVVLVVGSVLVKNFWCRYLCPYGALTGLLGLIGPTRIQRNPDTCIDCGKCTEACPHSINVNQKRTIFSAECSGCMDCTRVCPVQDTLHFETMAPKRVRRISTRWMAAIVVLFYTAVFMLAAATGNWRSQVPEKEFRYLLKQIESPLMTHPTI